MFSELEMDLVPTEYNGSMWQAVDYIFKQTEPVHYIESFQWLLMRAFPPKAGLWLSEVWGTCYKY